MLKMIADLKERVENSRKLKQTEPMATRQEHMAIVEKTVQQRHRIKLLGSILQMNKPETGEEKK